MTTYRHASRIPLLAVASWLLSLMPATAATHTISATPLAFGTYHVMATSATDSTGSVTFRCTGSGNSSGNRIAVTVTLNRGGSTTVLPRAMAGGGDTLTDTNITLTVYGRIRRSRMSVQEPTRTPSR